MQILSRKQTFQVSALVSKASSNLISYSTSLKFPL